MPRVSCIRIRTEIVIPYDRREFGATGAAEAQALKLKDVIGETMVKTAAVCVAWEAEHSTYATRETAPIPEPVSDDDAPPIPGFLVRK